jgi:uncharacterized protein
MALYASLTFGLWHNSVEARKQPIPAFIEHMRTGNPHTMAFFLWPVRRFNSTCRIGATPVSPQSLSDAELERVREILDRFGDKRAMNLEQIDGFLAALVCGPEDIPESEYLPEIWGDAMVNEAAFARQPILQVFVSLITRYRDAIAHTLRTGAVYTPLLLQNEDGVACGNDWANGFVRGMGLRKQLWTSLVDDGENGGSVVPIFALAYEHDPDPEMRSYDKPVSPELREKLIIGAAAAVMRIYRYFQQRRFTATYATGNSTTYQRVTTKVGRNEPCPCGSGKKYKQCCGRITLH